MWAVVDLRTKNIPLGWLLGLHPKQQEQGTEKPTDTFKTTSHPRDLTATQNVRIWTQSCASKIKTLEITHILTIFFVTYISAFLVSLKTGEPKKLMFIII